MYKQLLLLHVGLKVIIIIIKINYDSNLCETILYWKIHVKIGLLYLIDVNEELLKTFSTIDKSLSFCLLTPQTYATWYRHGFIVDLSCDGTLNFLHKVFTHTYILYSILYSLYTLNLYQLIRLILLSINIDIVNWFLIELIWVDLTFNIVSEATPEPPIIWLMNL